MKCEYCGRVLKPGEYNCPGCGATVENPDLASNNASTQGTNSGGGKIEVKVGGVNISIDGATNNIDVQTPPPVTQTPSPPPVGTPTYAKAGSNAPIRKVRYGGFFARVLAAWIDGVICGFVVMIWQWTTSVQIGSWLFFVFLSVYFIGCEAFGDGATVGKKGMRIKVVNSHFEKITLWQAILRTAFKYVSFSVGCLGILMVLFSNKKRGLHDIIANTYVIKE